MPDASRRNPRSHAAIMDAAHVILLEVGYQRLTIENVAARARVGKATIYRWWPTKVRLVVATLADRLVLEPVDVTGDLQDDVRALVHSAVEVFTKSALSFVLPEMAADLDEDPGARDALVDFLGPTRAANISVLYGAAGRTDLPYDVDAGLLLDLICGTILYRRLLGRSTGARFEAQLVGLVAHRTLPRS